MRGFVAKISHEMVVSPANSTGKRWPNRRLWRSNTRYAAPAWSIFSWLDDAPALRLSLDEHHAVRTDAGCFDVSHMTIVDLHGGRTRGGFYVICWQTRRREANEDG